MFYKKQYPEINYQIKAPESLKEGLSLEWLETNGLGGWASSTIYGTNTRRYHGLLVAAEDSYQNRIVLVSNQLEVLRINDQDYPLSTFAFPGVFHPEGHKLLQSFQQSPFPVFTYQIKHNGRIITISKEVFMPYGHNLTAISYHLSGITNEECSLQIEPFYACRPYHQLLRHRQEFSTEYDLKNSSFNFQAFENSPRIYAEISSGKFEFCPRWFHNLEYAQEDSRGYDFREDCFSLGKFALCLRQGSTHIYYTTEQTLTKQPLADLRSQELSRRQELIKTANSKTVSDARLTIAADHFIVSSKSKKDSLPTSKSIIAGYHWFTDWGRDAMISLPGLCLASNRLKEARDILVFFGNKIDQGLIPNRILENGEAEYNSVDASLWYIRAVYLYYLASKDRGSLRQILKPKVDQILHCYQAGTHFEIKVEPDLLLSAGSPETQLTWMDARIGEWVITPRSGKAVEINALWFNAIKIAAELERIIGSKKQSKLLERKADQIKKVFIEKFWCPERQYLYDVITDELPDPTLRPNQLLALSLEFPLISGSNAESILKIIKTKLLTPWGLRSLSPEDPNYRGKYQGDVVSRDASYHQGTVWGWLIGPYCQAHLKHYGPKAKPEIQEILTNFLKNLEEAGIGGISEIFDGDYPHLPRGCTFQAWSIAQANEIWQKINKPRFKI